MSEQVGSSVGGGVGVEITTCEKLMKSRPGGILESSCRLEGHDGGRYVSGFFQQIREG